MKISIIGSRSFDNFATVLDIWHRFLMPYDDEEVTIISGGCPTGGDLMAEKLAKHFDIPIKIFKPDWNRYGKSAGFRRNQLIVDASDMIVAFFDGLSRGTQHSLDLAKEQKKPTLIIYF